jgi:chemotaxis protein methyltransferase CheR
VKKSPSPAHLESFRALLEQQLGLSLDDSKLEGLADVLRRRMAAAAMPDAATYLGFLAASPTELRAVAGQVTVPETYFFRVPDHFRALQECVLPERIKAANGRGQLQVLSAGCASGEEAYSIAMLIADCAELNGWKVGIRGIDISSAAVNKGKAGRYSLWSLRGTDANLRKRHFRSHGRDFQLHDSIRQMVRLEEGNLLDAHASCWQPNSYDVIFFRNVLMYLTPEAGEQIVARMAVSLAPGGYLFLGSAESLRGISNDFHLCHTHGTFYYQCRRGQVDKLSSSVVAAGKAGSVSHLAGENGGHWTAVIERAAERIETLAQPPVHGGVAEGRRGHARTEVGQTLLDVNPALELLQKERFADALDALQHFPAGVEVNAEVHLLRAVLLVNRGDLAKAQEACALALEGDEFSAGAHYVLALCGEQAGQIEAAMEHNRTAAYLDQTFAMPHLHLGLLAKRAGDFHTARQELKQAGLLLAREGSSRILLFGGGFSRDALVELCRRELQTCGGRS